MYLSLTADSSFLLQATPGGHNVGPGDGVLEPLGKAYVGFLVPGAGLAWPPPTVSILGSGSLKERSLPVPPSFLLPLFKYT